MDQNEFWLEIIKGKNRGKSFRLLSDIITIGRRLAPQERKKDWILLDEPSLSRIHAQLNWDEVNRTYKLEHKSNAKTTKVNSKEIQVAFLYDQDRIQMGDVFLRFWDGPVDNKFEFYLEEELEKKDEASIAENRNICPKSYDISKTDIVKPYPALVKPFSEYDDEKVDEQMYERPEPASNQSFFKSFESYKPLNLIKESTTSGEPKKEKHIYQQTKASHDISSGFKPIHFASLNNEGQEEIDFNTRRLNPITKNSGDSESENNSAIRKNDQRDFSTRKLDPFITNIVEKKNTENFSARKADAYGTNLIEKKDARDFSTRKLESIDLFGKRSDTKEISVSPMDQQSFRDTSTRKLDSNKNTGIIKQENKEPGIIKSSEKQSFKPFDLIKNKTGKSIEQEKKIKKILGTSKDDDEKTSSTEFEPKFPTTADMNKEKTSSSTRSQFVENTIASSSFTPFEPIQTRSISSGYVKGTGKVLGSQNKADDHHMTSPLPYDDASKSYIEESKSYSSTGFSERNVSKEKQVKSTIHEEKPFKESYQEIKQPKYDITSENLFPDNENKTEHFLKRNVVFEDEKQEKRISLKSIDFAKSRHDMSGSENIPTSDQFRDNSLQDEESSKFDALYGNENIKFFPSEKNIETKSDYGKNITDIPLPAKRTAKQNSQVKNQQSANNGIDWEILILKGPKELVGTSLSIPYETITIGKSNKNDIRINDDQIAETHIKLFFDDKKPSLQKEDKTPPIFINGKILITGGKKILNEGDKIQLSSKTTIVITPKNNETF